MANSDDERSFADDRMRRIIQRAAEMERDTEPRVSAHRLGEIAAEVGIDADSLAKAIEQTDAEDRRKLTPPTTTSRAAAKFMARVGPFTAGATGLLLGNATGVLRNLTNGLGGVHVDTLIGTMLAGIAALLIALAARETKSPLGFQLRSAALWAGFTAGFALGFPMLAGDMLGVGAGLVFVSGVLGAVIVAAPGTPGGWLKRLQLKTGATRSSRPEQHDIDAHLMGLG